MTTLRLSVLQSTLDRVQIVRVDRETTKWWNQRRRPEDTVIFCGWYWVRGREEAGPFGTRSAAIRDAYYRFVLRREMPGVGHRVAYPTEAEPRNTRKIRRVV